MKAELKCSLFDVYTYLWPFRDRRTTVLDSLLLFFIIILHFYKRKCAQCAKCKLNAGTRRASYLTKKEKIASVFRIDVSFKT